MVSTLHHDPSVLGGPTRQRSPSKTVGAGAVAVLRSSSCEEIPQGKGQRRSPSKTVGGAKSHLESYPIPARNAQGAQTNLVRARTRDPTETQTELCVSFSCGGVGQQWTAAGTAALGVGMA